MVLLQKIFRKHIIGAMSIKEGGDQTAADLVRKRWDKTPPAERSAHARKMALARWGPKKKAAAKKKPKNKCGTLLYLLT
jgi:hypothetical protein